MQSTAIRTVINVVSGSSAAPRGTPATVDHEFLACQALSQIEPLAAPFEFSSLLREPLPLAGRCAPTAMKMRSRNRLPAEVITRPWSRRPSCRDKTRWDSHDENDAPHPYWLPRPTAACSKSRAPDVARGETQISCSAERP